MTGHNAAEARIHCPVTSQFQCPCEVAVLVDLHFTNNVQRRFFRRAIGDTAEIFSLASADHEVLFGLKLRPDVLIKRRPGWVIHDKAAVVLPESDNAMVELIGRQVFHPAARHCHGSI